MTVCACGVFSSGAVSIREAALFTDLYGLTMAASYHREGMHEPATFSLFVRRLPPGRGFLVAAGLEAVLRYLESFEFSEDSLRYLHSLRLFPAGFLHFLADVGFTGTVRAVPEGTVIFEDEPLLEVTAPIIEAQLVETAVMNLCHLETVLASKGARAVLAARGRPVVDFGLRRTHGLDAGMKAARCAYLAGRGDDEQRAGGHAVRPAAGRDDGPFVRVGVSPGDRRLPGLRPDFPGRHHPLAPHVRHAGRRPQGGDRRPRNGGPGPAPRRGAPGHGDIVALSRAVRRILDEAGLQCVRIFASG